MQCSWKAGNQALPEGSKLEVCSLQGLRVSLSIQQRRHRPVWMQLLWKAALWQKQSKKEWDYSSQWYGCMISVFCLLRHYLCHKVAVSTNCALICILIFSVRDFMGWKFSMNYPWNKHTNKQRSMKFIDMLIYVNKNTWSPILCDLQYLVVLN